jgi:hypothetical protein
MNKVSKLSAIALVLLFHLVSFGMQTVSRLPIQQQRRVAKNTTLGNGAVVRKALAIENRYQQKLLEHSCFKGESLLFQNMFFSSDYTDTPKPVLEHFNVVAQPLNGSIDLMNYIFAYHTHYRKDCLNRTYLLWEDISIKMRLYERRLDKLSKNPDDAERFIDVLATRDADLLPQINAFESMKDAFFANDYPYLLWIRENYKKGTLS